MAFLVQRSEIRYIVAPKTRQRDVVIDFEILRQQFPACRAAPLMERRHFLGDKGVMRRRFVGAGGGAWLNAGTTSGLEAFRWRAVFRAARSVSSSSSSSLNRLRSRTELSKARAADRARPLSGESQEHTAHAKISASSSQNIF